MNLPELIETYGYWVVFGGTLLEGESVLLLAGFAAHRGLLELHTVIGVAIFGSFLGDQLLFFLGRYQGAKLLGATRNTPRRSRSPRRSSPDTTRR